MFDPNVSDPLVIEHGPESYGVIAPMEFIVNAAIFNDIAHMRVGTGEYTSNTNEKPEVYHTKTCNRCETHSPGKDSLLVKDETFPELGASSSVDQESNCSTERDDGDAFPKAFDRELVTPVDADSIESAAENKKDDSKLDGDVKNLEDRRKSLLDQHWAIPSKDRWENKRGISHHISPLKSLTAHSFACFICWLLIKLFRLKFIWNIEKKNLRSGHVHKTCREFFGVFKYIGKGRYNEKLN